LKKTVLIFILLMVMGRADASSGAEDDAMGYYLKGSMAEARNDLMRAYAYYSAAARAEEGNEIVIYSLARVAYNLGKTGEAREFAGRILQSREFGSRAVLLLAEVEYREGNSDKAIELFRQVMDDEEIPGFEVRKILARIYLEKENIPGAKAMLEEARRLYQFDLFVNYRLGFMYAEAGEIDSAIVSFEDAIESNPGFANAYTALASMQLRKGDRAKAKGAFENAVRLDPENRSAVKDLADLYYEDGEYENGAALLEGFYREKMLDEEGKIALGKFYYRLGESGKALDLFKGMLETLGEKPPILRIVSEIETEMGNFRTAVGYMRRLIELEKDNFNNYIGMILIAFDLAGPVSGPDESPQLSKAEGRYFLKESVRFHDRDSAADTYILGSVHRKAGDLERAEDFLLRAEELQPGDQRTLLELASLFEAKGEFDKALERVRFLHERTPDDPSISNFYGYLLAEQGKDLELAERLLDNALAAQPGNGYFLDSMGWIKYMMGDYEKAREILLRALSIVGDDPVIWEHLGDACLKLDLLAEAEEAYSKSVSIDPENPGVRTKLEKVRNAAVESD